jgi:hypothetical protein
MKLLGRDKAATRAAASQPHGGAWLLGPAGVIIIRRNRVLLPGTVQSECLEDCAVRQIERSDRF